MTFLPVVERELRVAARKRATYWNRFGAALTAIGISVWVLVTSGHATPDYIGRELFHTLLVILYVYIGFAGAQATCDSLTTEKRDGTLGLLFLTDLKGYDVILGKMASHSAAIIYRVLSILPVLAISFMMGGVSYGEMGRSALAAMNLLFVSLSVGMFASSVSRDGWAAMRLSFFILMFLLMAMPLLGFFMHVHGALENAMGACSLAYGCVAALDQKYATFHTWFWQNVVWMQVFAWTFLGLACRAVPRTWQDRPMSAKPGIWQGIKSSFAMRPSAKARAEMLEHNPYLWRAKHQETATIQIWGALALLAVTWLVVRHYSKGNVIGDLMPLLVAHLVIKVIAASEAPRAIAEDRHCGAMELLLTTPLTPDHIIRGQGRAFFTLLVKPVTLVIAIDTLCLALGYSDMSKSGDRDVMFAAYFVAAGALVLDIVAASWVGIWLGLSARSAFRATSGTLLRILIVPVLVFVIIGTLAGTTGKINSFGAVVFLWVAISLTTDIAFMAHAQSQLQGQFRSIVSGTVHEGETVPGRFALFREEKE